MHRSILGKVKFWYDAHMNSSQDNQEKLYREFLENKHGGWQTPFNLLEECVLQGSGSSIQEMERIVEGEANEVYRVLTTDEQRLILRISHAEWPRFEVEKWAIDASRNQGVTAPEVLLLTKNELAGQDVTLCLEREIPGASLRKLFPSLSESKSGEILSHVGKVLSQIHEVQTPYYGWDFLGDWQKFTTWSEFLESMLPQDRLLEVLDRHELDPKLYWRTRDILSTHSSLFRMDHPHLLHGDCTAKHFLVHEGSLSGVIDFESARGGDQVFDLAWWNFFESNYRADRLIPGYSHPEWLTHFEEKLLAYQAVIGASLLDYYDSEQNVQALQTCAQKVDRVLANLD